MTESEIDVEPKCAISVELPEIMTGAMRMIPWVLCTLTAVWFAWLAFRAGRGWLLWAIGGGLFALVTSTAVLGLGDAAYIPISHQAHLRFQLGIVATACVLVILLGWVFTAHLHGQHRSIWAQIRLIFKRPVSAPAKSAPVPAATSAASSSSSKPKS
jgi:hypothetical protein